MKFDYIIQNPPYSGLTHIDFLRNMYDLLPASGRMVIIQPSRFYIELRETKDRKEVFNPVIDHIKDNVYKIIIETLAFDFKITNEIPLAITYIDKSKTYKEKELIICGEQIMTDDIYDCNLIGKRAVVNSILNKVQKYPDMMINHKDKKSNKDTAAYVKYQGRVLMNVAKHFYTGNRYGDYNNLGNFIKDEIHGLTLFRPYFDCCFFKNREIYNSIQDDMQNYIICDIFESYEQNKEALINWKHFIYETYLGHFIPIVCLISKQNTVYHYMPFIIEHMNDKQLYEMFGFTEEEIELIESTCKKFDRENWWFKRYATGDMTIKKE